MPHSSAGEDNEGTGSPIGKLILESQILKWYEKDFTSFS
jgi:hypothetical protein